MLHAVETNESSSATESGLAVDSDGSIVSNFVLSGSEELWHNLIGWCSAVNEEQIQMFDSLFSELALFVLWLVETDDKRHSHFLENGHVVVWGEGAVPVSHIEGARKGHELVGYNPVQVAILHLFKVLVLLNVECAIVVPAKGHRELKTLEAMVVSALVGTIAHGGITVGDELVVVWAEGGPSFVCRLLQHDDHESAHQEGCVALLRVVQRRVVVNLVVLILLVVH